MSLNNEHDEKSQWHLQLEQERQKLSASIAEALAGTQAADDDWEEDEQVDARIETAGEPSVIPPRLSLQSKVLPTVHARDVEAMPSTPGKAKVPATEDGQKDSVFVRLARRLTSSFSTFGVSIQAEMEDIPTRPAALARPQHTQGERSGAVPPEKATQPPWLRPGQKLDVVDAPASASMPALPAAGGTSSPENKRRLARTTRVHLETASVPNPPPTASIAQPTRTDNAVPTQPFNTHQSEGIINDRWQDTDVDVALSRNTSDKTRETSVKLPAIAIPPHTASSLLVPTSPRQFFGSGMFVSGQGDKMVEDRNVTEKCVVLVMLTSNPGPVVVHYISLYPGTGFTIHLTAPTDKEAGFNYVILAGEQG